MQIVTILLAAIIGSSSIAGFPVESADLVCDTLHTAKISADKSGMTSGITPIQRITAEQIELRGAIHIDEVLKTLPGVSVKDYGGIGGLKTVSIRNLGAQHTAVVYNGMLISDAQNGQTDISRFSLSGIKDINVQTGVSDNLLLPAKSAAMAGIVNIRGKVAPENPGEYNADISYLKGDFNTRMLDGNIRLRINPVWGVKAALNVLESDGNYPFTIQNGQQILNLERTNSDVKRIQGEFANSADFGKKGKLQMWLNYYDSQRGLPGSVVLYTEDKKDRLHDSNLIANAIYKRESDVTTFTGSAGFHHSESAFLDTNPALPGPRTDRYLQDEISTNAAALYAASGCLNFAIAEDLYLNTLSTNVLTSQVSRISSYSGIRAKYTEGALNAVASITYIFIKEKEEKNQDSSHFVPEIAISYRLPSTEDIHIRTFCKYGLRLPTFNDLYYSRVGNRDLRPEKAKQIGAGMTWYHPYSRGSVSMTTDAYHYLVKDKIVAIPTMFIWRMRNVGLVAMDGIDISAGADITPSVGFHLNARATYSYQHAIDITDNSAKNYGHQIAYTPRNSGNGLLAIETPWVNISYTLILCGERYSLAQNAPAYRLEPYADHSISISKDFTLPKSVMHISTEILNMAGHNYQIIQYYPMPGRNYRFTIKFTI